MLDFNRIIDEVCGEARPIRQSGISKTASRNHYEWSLPNGMKTGDRVRLEDGREGALTSPFPGCRGDGDWCGIFLDDGSEENIRPDRVASAFGRKVADDGERDKPARPVHDTADGVPIEDSDHPGNTVRYTVEFRGHGTDHMSARMTKDASGDDSSAVAGHVRSAKLLQALVEFEDNGTEAETETEMPTDELVL